jgi:hypothetical protein
MPNLQDIFSKIEAHHYWEPADSPLDITAFQIGQGFDLPADLVEFYKRYKSVRLFCNKGEALYRFVPISEIHPTRIDIYGESEDDWGPDSWLTICDVRDGNYVAIDVESRDVDKFNYIDCFHETFAEPGESRIIALSFEEFLRRSLENRGSVYFLEPDFIDYGDGRPLTANNATIRIENPKAPRKGWLVKFTILGSRKCFHKFFADDEFGGKEKGFEAVKRYIEESSDSAK